MRCGAGQTSGSDVKQGDEPWFEINDKEGSAKGFWIWICKVR